MDFAIDILIKPLNDFVEENPNWATCIKSFTDNYRKLDLDQMIEIDCGKCKEFEDLRSFIIIMQYFIESPKGANYFELDEIITRFVSLATPDIEKNVLPILISLYFGAIGKEIEIAKKLLELKPWIRLYSRLYKFNKNNEKKIDLTQFQVNLSLQISFRTCDLYELQLEECNKDEFLNSIKILVKARRYHLDVDSSVSNLFTFVFGGLAEKYNIYLASNEEKQTMNLKFGKEIVTSLIKLRLDEYNKGQLNVLIDFFKDHEEGNHQSFFSGLVFQQVIYASTANPKVHVVIDHCKTIEGYDVAVKTYTAKLSVDDISKASIEIDILEKLSNISAPDNCFLKFYGSSWDGLKVYLAMEYHSLTLMQYISELKKDQNYLTEEWLIFFTHQLCEGFSVMEELGIYHQDIKPHNILITNQKYLKIIDFSISCVRTQADATVAATGMHLIQGTSGYMAPELEDNLKNPQKIAKFKINKADVFSLGMTLLQLWTFEELYTLNLTENNNRLMEKVKRLNVEWFKTLLWKMLCLNYDNRISFREALRFIPTNKTTMAN